MEIKIELKILNISSKPFLSGGQKQKSKSERPRRRKAGKSDLSRDMRKTEAAKQRFTDSGVEALEIRGIY